MSTVQNQQKITITAHQSHWWDVLGTILKVIGTVNPVLAVFLPAPIEAGIQVAIDMVPVVVGTLNPPSAG